MTIFDDYIRNKGCCKVSKTLLWDYDLTQFDWQRSRKVVVQRIIERGWLRDYFAAFDLYGGIEGFREIIKEVPTLSAQDMNFVCTAFGLKSVSFAAIRIPNGLQAPRHAERHDRRR